MGQPSWMPVITILLIKDGTTAWCRHALLNSHVPLPMMLYDMYERGAYIAYSWTVKLQLVHIHVR